jgi:hypothetical protein
VGGLQPDHARHQRVVVRNGAPAHQGRDHRDVQQFGQLDQLGGGVGVDYAPARHDEGTAGGEHHVQGLRGLGAGGRGASDLERLIHVDVEFDLGQLHVQGKVQQGRPRATGAHEVEGLLESPGDLARLQHGHGHFG